MPLILIPLTESPVDEITVEAENKPDIPMTDVEELIKAMETAEVQGRDDRMSSSSDEQQFVITDDLKGIAQRCVV